MEGRKFNVNRIPHEESQKIPEGPVGEIKMVLEGMKAKEAMIETQPVNEEVDTDVEESSLEPEQEKDLNRTIRGLLEKD